LEDVMQHELADRVFAVFENALQLSDRLTAGEDLDLRYEQAVLRDLLTTEPLTISLPGRTTGKTSESASLGVTYPLTCWLDELFTSNAKWGKTWNENKLESDLFGSNDRAWKFWDQAEIARKHRDEDCLEVHYLCVMLGFRGQYRTDPAQCQSWLQRTEIALSRVQPLNWPALAEMDPPCDVPPLTGRQKLRRTIAAGWMAALVLLPLSVFALLRSISA
jgi:type VI secretion system protein ImpK